jgi:hypothetical protein
MTAPMPQRPVRLSDAERDKVATFLREQADEGRISLLELEERLDTVYKARFRDDLAGVADDLPVPRTGFDRPAPTHHGPPVRPRHGDGGFAVHLRIYLVIMVFLSLIWLLTNGPTGYFWPIWPALGWGVGVASHWAAVRR